MRVPVRFFTLIVVSLASSPALVSAQTQSDINAAGRQGDAIQNQQQLQLLRDQQAARRALAPNGIDLNQLAPPKAAPTASLTCQNISKILVIDAPFFPEKALVQLNQDYAGKCLAVKDIEAILASVTRFYIEKGYITTRAYLPEQDLSTHRLVIKVVIGQVQKISVEDGGKHSVSVPTIFPGAIGKPLNLRDFEQGIDQINRLASNNAQMDVVPGSGVGESIVVVRNAPSFPVHGLATYDNQGSVSTGANQAAATVGVDNILGFDEYLSMTRRTSVPSSGAHKSSTDDVNFSIPFGYNLLTLDASASRYESVLVTPSGQQLLSSGTSHNRSVSLNQVNYRDQNSRWSTSETFTAKSANNYLADQLLGVNSRNLSVLDLGTNYSVTLGGGYMVGQLDYQRGLKADKALQDMPGLERQSPHAQFNKWTLDLDFTRSFAALGQDFVFNTHFNGQYAPQALFGSEQIAIGGIYSVRGFNNLVILGDKGYYLRNELSMPKSFTIGGEPATGRLRAGFDYGHVISTANGVQEGTLSGLTFGLSMTIRRFTVELFESSPLTLPHELKRESAQTWFRLTYGI
ncbi:ShlB/FhaC/HecB family hemolysin secretion/activation protein [Massilia sp. 9096]|uniref:ShlB/FhaC/HecB family hemolysin secretion/activation protein n=1 Tax=Massilia sp. 9096 TaxID=1500894 RepID=UPI0009E00269|nr:ShlB/FhaC/HecB family hemolysin secretion/activation protein [Massilia sp. 9096]